MLLWKALVFDRFFDWDFDISVGAIQGHTHRDIPGNVAEEALGERLTAERCRQSIRERGLILTAVCSSGQRHRKATHFVFAGGEYLLVQVQ